MQHLESWVIGPMEGKQILLNIVIRQRTAVSQHMAVVSLPEPFQPDAALN
jgi:hypothetical protein